MVNRQLLGELARRAPLLPGKDTLAFIDIDAMQKRVYGHHKQGAGFGHTKIQGKSLLVRGLNALAATICTPLGAPVIAATRLRGGTANSARGAAGSPPRPSDGPRHRVRRAGHRAGGLGLLLRRVLRRGPPGRPRFSVTVNMDPKIAAAIAAIPGRPGRRSATRARSGTASSGRGSPTPRSRRRNTPRSPPRRARRSPPG